MDYSPDVAEDQPVPLRKRIEIAHSRPASASACSIGSKSSGLLSSRNLNGGGSTSTTSKATPAVRKRRCSSIQRQRWATVRIYSHMHPDWGECVVECALRQVRNEPLREIEGVPAIVGDDAGSPHAPFCLLCLKHSYFRTTQPDRGRRDLRFPIFTHVADQGFNEMCGRQQGVALQIHDQINVAKLSD